METVFLSLSRSDLQDLIAESVNACLNRHSGLQLLSKSSDSLTIAGPKYKERAHGEHIPSGKKGGRHESE